MKIIQVTKKTNHKIEQIEALLTVLCTINEVHLSKTDLKVLAYFVVYGMKESTDTLLFNSGIIQYGALGNTKTKLFKLGFLKRDKTLYKTYSLNIAKDFDVSSNIIKVDLKIDNS